MTTFSPKTAEITRAWYVVDASEHTLGRLATEIARLLKGKHKPIYSPHMDTGDHVIVINAAQIKATGNKLTQKKYIHHSNYPGGLKTEIMRDILAKHPERLIEEAVKGMLPHNRMGREMIKKMKVYAGNEHPHAAQMPVDYTFSESSRGGR